MKWFAYVRIARPDYWTNNVFIIPGVILGLFYAPHLNVSSMWIGILGGIVASCLVASSNYVLNEILDASRDKFHPEKRNRPIVAGEVVLPLAYLEWLLLAAAAFGLGFVIQPRLGGMIVVFWIAALLYNTPPVRFKDLPYADVLSESVNNPIRMAIGWFSTGIDVLPPVSILLAYWAFGAFLMTMKRYAEYRMIRHSGMAGQYRSSFRHYSEERLMECVFFYGALFGMLSGFFMARYHIELILATPLVAYAMAYYMHLGFKLNSPVQHPERLYRERKLVLLSGLAFLACAVLLYVEIPVLEEWMAPWCRPLAKTP